MTITDLVYRRALSMLWSAGHEPSRSQRIKMQSDAWRVGIPAALSDDAINKSACELLRLYGYAPNPEAPAHQALPETQILHRHAPKPGDLVRLTGPWNSLKPGETLTLAARDDGSLCIGKGRHYMNEESGVRLNSGGGPASILGLNPAALTATPDTGVNWFWRFHGLPEAGGGVDFARPVAIWEWNGDANDFVIPEPASEAVCL